MTHDAPNPAQPNLAQAVNGMMRAGRAAEAEAGLRDLIARNPGHLEAQALLGSVLFQQKRWAEAAKVYETSVAAAPEVAPFHFNLGTAREEMGDLAGAVEAYLAAWRLDRKNAHIGLFAGAALEAIGRREQAAAMFSFADDQNGVVMGARDNPREHPEIRRRSEIANRVVREQFTDLHARAVNAAEQALKDQGVAEPDLSRVRGGVWPKTHTGPVTYRTPLHEPSVFFMPELPPRPTTPRARLSWAEAVEAATDVIRDEYLAAVESGAAFAPYVEGNAADPTWGRLSGRLDWSSFHLFKGGVRTPLADLFPKTLKALEPADVVRRADGSAVEMFFSRLKPGAHIPPHYGCANHRITVHLPLIVPPDCAIRVGDEVHAWREGELFAFDDSFEHEAWNRSGEDRVVLIFESQNVDLTPDERFAVQHCFDVRGNWNDRRETIAEGG
jgi:tetratricopeptide (TPR) repeat protein